MKIQIMICLSAFLFCVLAPVAQTASGSLDITQPQAGAPRDISADAAPVRNISARMVSADKIRVEWESSLDVDADIEYYDPLRNREWQHSVLRYRGPVELREGGTLIGVGANTDRIIRIKLDAPEWVSDPVHVPAWQNGEKKNGGHRLPDFERLQYRGVVIPESGRRVRAGGLALHEKRVMLMAQTRHRIRGTLSTTGDTYFSDNFTDWEGGAHNPVFTDFQPWQGQSEDGVAWRAGMLTGFAWQDVYISYFQDRVGAYPGMRAPGVAVSSNGTDWTLSSSWFMSVEDVRRVVPEQYFEADPVFTHGRIYIHHAETDGAHVYISISTVVNGMHDGRRYDNFLLRGTDPFDIDTFEFVRQFGYRSFHWTGAQWLVMRNIAGARSVSISVQASLEDPFIEAHRMENHSRNNPFKYLPLYHNDTWYILYTDRNHATHLISE